MALVVPRVEARDADARGGRERAGLAAVRDRLPVPDRVAAALGAVEVRERPGRGGSVRGERPIFLLFSFFPFLWLYSQDLYSRMFGTSVAGDFTTC